MATRDGCAVEGKALAALIGAFVQDWNRDRPATDGRFRSGGSMTVHVDPVRPYQWLSDATGIRPRTLERLAGARLDFVPLGVADRIVQALGYPMAFHDGTLEVTANPAASRAARASCQSCGGARVEPWSIGPPLVAPQN